MIKDMVLTLLQGETSCLQIDIKRHHCSGPWPPQPSFGTLVLCDCQRVSADKLKCYKILLIACFLLKSGLFSKK